VTIMLSRYQVLNYEKRTVQKEKKICVNSYNQKI
jgi:hypothetical protein